jgi:hypothetical protein
MKKPANWKRWLARAAIVWSGLLLLLVLAVFAINRFNLFHAHEHCMKGAGLSLLMYASEHQGRFPYHTNGFGDALILVLRESGDKGQTFTAPGDDGALLNERLKSGEDVPEARCTRAYVQGLCETNNPEIALLFDRYPTRGGDHGRRPWGPKLREVWMLGGDHRIIREGAWPKFREQQIALLVAEGIPRSEAETYYSPPRR